MYIKKNITDVEIRFSYQTEEIQISVNTQATVKRVDISYISVINNDQDDYYLCKTSECRLYAMPPK